MMRTSLLAAALMTLLAACGKKADDVPATDAMPTAAQQSSSTPAQASSADGSSENAKGASNVPADDSEEARARAGQQGKLDYASMEDGYLNDANGQWATSATASSSFGDANDAAPDSHDGNTPWRATGVPDGDDWTNNSQDVGFDWLQLKYDNAVTPAEIRAVFSGDEALQAITKVELIDLAGKPHVVWSGLSDSNRDERGRRTWFMRKVDGADYTADTVKLTFANNVSNGYKTVDAVQLVAR